MPRYVVVGTRPAPEIKRALGQVLAEKGFTPCSSYVWEGPKGSPPEWPVGTVWCSKDDRILVDLRTHPGEPQEHGICASSPGKSAPVARGNYAVAISSQGRGSDLEFYPQQSPACALDELYRTIRTIFADANCFMAHGSGSADFRLLE